MRFALHNKLPISLLVPAIALVLTSCAPVGPDFVKPEPEAPEDWSQPVSQGLDTAPNELVEWWRVFKDPVMDELVEAALQDNNTLEIAGLRVLESLAQLGIATGAKYPQSQFAAGEAIYVSPADNTGATSNF